MLSCQGQVSKISLSTSDVLRMSSDGGLKVDYEAMGASSMISLISFLRSQGTVRFLEEEGSKPSIFGRALSKSASEKSGGPRFYFCPRTLASW